ncbi:hypothetical protein JCM19300_1182 [Algibacter lectus]|uniref:Uncharacterized protein n=1 Tax=Algibacter lectus TaxID=221126 RepID=A0A090VEE4_9FLAO|nr:hypothetical protein JCM19300_1182 [Algibacter lectus]GAL81355.1 hypothetical protein JCM19274_2431 [Algibacter lectus]
MKAYAYRDFLVLKRFFILKLSCKLSGILKFIVNFVLIISF